MSYRTLWTVAVVAVAVAAGQAGAVPPKAGESFPDLKKAQLEGALPSLAGKVVLVDFWASWCGPCKQSFPVMDKLYQDYKDKGLQIVAISVDEDKEEMERFLKEHAVTFTILRDAQQKLVESVNIEAMPTSFLLDGKGKIVAIHRKYEGKETEDQLRKEIEELLGLKKKEGTK